MPPRRSSTKTAAATKTEAVASAAPGGDHVDIIKSPNDPKLYKYLVLENGIKVLLVHDPEITMDQAGEEEAEEEDESGSEGEEGSGSDEEEGTGEDEEEGDDVEGAMEHDEEEEDGAGGRGRSAGPSAPKKKAAAALSVRVGSFGDPEDLLGLSHYLEHMLFMGSERFPTEDDYDAFLTRHGGSSNAYTDTEFTNFHFDVQPAALEGALERFAQFFIAPLCLESSLDREVNAVDHEFSGVLQSDSCRAAQLRCHTARPGHVYAKFTWGNRRSLVEDPAARGVRVRERLLEYYRSHYSSERMSLVLLGGQGLEELERLAREHFSAVPRVQAVQEPRYDLLPFPFAHPPSFFVFPSVKEQHWIHVCFQLPPQFHNYSKKAEDYISHLVGHEGAGSLLSALKRRGWATELVSGVSEGGYDRNSNVFLFSVSITLTEKGLEEDLGLGAVRLLFQYLDLLRAGPPERWVWDELKAIADLRFRFQEEDDAMDFVSGVAGTLPLYRPEHALCGDVLHEEFDPALVGELLALMTSRSPGLRVELQTKAYEAVKGRLGAAVASGEGPLAGPPEAVTSSVEPWFQLPYTELPLSEATLSFLERPAGESEVALPARNAFIPTDFSLRCEGEGAAAPPAEPQLLRDEPGLRIWHKTDATFKTPRTAAYFFLYSPHGYAESPRGAALSYLAARLWEEATCETVYLADSAGLNTHIHAEGLHGIALKLWGFSHKLPELSRALFSALRALPATLRADPSLFDRVKEAAVKKFRNHNLQPSKAATWTRLLAIRRHMWHCDLELQQIEALALEDLLAFLEGPLLRPLHLEALLHGNITQEEARALCGEALQTLTGGASPLPAPRRLEDEILRLAPGTTVIALPAKNAEEKNSALENYYQCGLDSLASPRARVLGDLLEQAMYEPCFDELRTKQQLGYTVFCGMRLTQGVVGYAVHVVSSTRPPAYLDARVEEFLSAFGERLAAMAPAEFEQHREALINAKLMKDRGLTDETDRHWYQVQRRTYSFSARDREVEELRAVTQEELVRWYGEHVAPSAPGRRKLSVRVVGRQHWDAEAGWENEVVAAGPQDGQEGSQKRRKTDSATASKPLKVGEKDLECFRADATKKGEVWDVVVKHL